MTRKDWGFSQSRVFFQSESPILELAWVFLQTWLDTRLKCSVERNFTRVFISFMIWNIWNSIPYCKHQVSNVIIYACFNFTRVVFIIMYKKTTEQHLVTEVGCLLLACVSQWPPILPHVVPQPVGRAPPGALVTSSPLLPGSSVSVWAGACAARPHCRSSQVPPVRTRSPVSCH